jgi:hypothetical protein
VGCKSWVIFFFFLQLTTYLLQLIVAHDIHVVGRLSMKDIYKKIWGLAKSYYKKGRPMDIAHIEWFMKEAKRISKIECLDDTILIPFAILHDVGYSEIQNVKNINYYDTDIRKAHMAAGKVIAVKILHLVHYPKDKIDAITEYIGIHDNWAFGKVELYISDPILGTFKDLDYLWMFTKEGCRVVQAVLKKTDQEMLEYLRSEPSPIGGKKPFTNESTKQLHAVLLREREKEYGHKT